MAWCHPHLELLSLASWGRSGHITEDQIHLGTARTSNKLWPFPMSPNPAREHGAGTRQHQQTRQTYACTDACMNTYMLCVGTNTLAWTHKGLHGQMLPWTEICQHRYMENTKSWLLPASTLLQLGGPLGWEAELSSAAVFPAGALRPSALCRFHPNIPLSLLYSHWSSTRLQDNKMTIYLNQICTWSCTYLYSPLQNAICYKDRKKN